VLTVTDPSAIKSIRVVAGIAIPFGVRAIVMAKVALQLSKFLRITLWIALIASSLFGLGLLVMAFTKPTSVKKIYHLLSDDRPVKDHSTTDGVLPPYVPTY
jgi:hypothetical protein